MHLICQVKKWFKANLMFQTVTYFMGLAFILTISPEALAQETPGFPFSPTPGDLSIKLIGRMFGGLVTAVGGTGTGDPFGEAIGTFNASILAVGGILAAYTIFAGTIGTAHDGEMMGKKFSSAWVPIRTAMGSALVLPIIKGGYCTMQVIVMWLIFQGVGLADSTWQSYLKNITDGMYSSMPPAPRVSELAGNILMASVCAKAMNSASDVPIVKTTQVLVGGWGYTKDAASRKIDFGTNQGLSEMKTLCGTVSYGSPAQSAITAGVSAASSAISGGGSASSVVEESAKIFQMVNTQKISQAQEKATDALITTMQPIADKIIANTKVDPTEIDKAAAVYQKTILEAAVAVQNDKNSNPINDIIESSNKQGWFVAGAWYMKVVNANNKIFSAVNAIPGSSAARSATGQVGGLQDASSAMYRAERIIGETNDSKRNGVNNNPDAGPSWYHPIDKLVFEFSQKIVALFTGMQISNLSKRTEHPIVIMNSLGNYLIGASMSFFTLVVATLSFAGAAATVGTNFALAVLPLVTTIFGALIGSGFMLSYYIPMVPFLIWVGAILGWIILVVEAIIAAPLWAVMHLHPHGDDLTGKGGAGYMLVLGLILRPVIMIFGLIASLVIVQVFGEMLNKIYYDALTLSSDESPSLFGIIFGFVIYVSLMTTFIQKAFSIIHVIPDQLLRYIGGGGAQLGEYAGAFNSSGQGAATAAGGIVGQRLGGGLANAASDFKGRQQRGKELKMQEEDKELQKESNQLSQERNNHEMNKETPGKADYLNNIKDPSEKVKEEGRISSLQKIGGAEAAASYIQRASESKGSKNSNTDAAFASTRKEAMEETYGKDIADYINKAGDEGRNGPAENTAINQAAEVIELAGSKNAAQEVFAKANQAGEAEETKLSSTPTVSSEIKGMGGEAKTGTSESKAGNTQSAASIAAKVSPSDIKKAGAGTAKAFIKEVLDSGNLDSGKIPKNAENGPVLEWPVLENTAAPENAKKIAIDNASEPELSETKLNWSANQNAEAPKNEEK